MIGGLSEPHGVVDDRVHTSTSHGFLVCYCLDVRVPTLQVLQDVCTYVADDIGVMVDQNYEVESTGCATS